MARKALCIFLSLLSLFLIGTVVVLTTVVSYFGVDGRDVITEAEMRLYERLAASERDILRQVDPVRQNIVVASSDVAAEVQAVGEKIDAPALIGVAGDRELSAAPVHAGADGIEAASDPGTLLRRTAEGDLPGLGTTAARTPRQRIPKIVHQTWKTDVLPERWDIIRKECMELHPDYEYKLWSDKSARDFIAEHYEWFLPNFDGYRYPIQRADAIRYFVLHYYGGIYMDLDVGCRRNMDPLLYFQVILPATIPVGVSNDIMLAEKGHPFMDLVIHNLVTFDHQYGTNYPTVMFSTGPMFLSAQYGLWPKDQTLVLDRQVRVLPRRWYGKNAPETEMADSFFTHFYGSSWHADDAGFITFLGKFGMALMYLGLAVVIFGALRLLWSKRPSNSRTPKGPGPIALPLHLPSDGSRPSSPFTPRSSTPAAASRETPSRGVLYYLPVWLSPSGERTSAAGGWSQYLPGLPAYDEENGYEPLPPFSRPASPSNDSILHAPGPHHGNFDGVNLHSMRAPAPAYPSSAPSTAPPTPTPSSPPAYSSLRTWGSRFFRPSPRIQTLAGLPGPGDSPTSPPPDRLYPAHYSKSHTTGSSRPVSPRPDGEGPRSRSPRPPPQYGEGRGSFDYDFAAGAPHRRAVIVNSDAERDERRHAKRGGRGGNRSGEEHAGHRGFALHSPSPSLSAPAPGALGPGPAPPGQLVALDDSEPGSAVEEEVDRLLSEMTPHLHGSPAASDSERSDGRP